MKTTETLVIGAGQAGLAVSRCLADRGRDHVVVERGRVAERWRSERWDSLRLLTPNWMTRLPGHSYRGADPDGFMGRAQVVDFLAGYARSFAAPVLTGTTVQSVGPVDEGGRDGWRVATDRGTWHAGNVVIATGSCDVPRVPALAAALAPEIRQVTTRDYRGPDGLPAGGVLVVGASATGVQLADEISRSGREVALAVGRHNRLPRRYRGRDVMWWLDRTGVLDRPIESLPRPEEGSREPSLQLVGRGDGETLDLDALAARGVRLAGRLTGARGTRVRFDRDLGRRVEEADARLAGLLARIDRYAARHGLDAELPPPDPPPESAVDGPGPAGLDLRAEGIRTVVWATGFRRTYPWLHAPVLDGDGEIRHRRGRTPLPGLYVLGLQFLTRRRSSFIDGVGRDAEEIAEEIAARSGRRRPLAA